MPTPMKSQGTIRIEAVDVAASPAPAKHAKIILSNEMLFGRRPILPRKRVAAAAQRVSRALMGRRVSLGSLMRLVMPVPFTLSNRHQAWLFQRSTVAIIYTCLRRHDSI